MKPALCLVGLVLVLALIGGVGWLEANSSTMKINNTFGELKHEGLFNPGSYQLQSSDTVTISQTETVIQVSFKRGDLVVKEFSHSIKKPMQIDDSYPNMGEVIIDLK